MTDRLELDERFQHHPPSHKGIEAAHNDLRYAFRAIARVVVELCPEGREKSLALTKIEEGMFWANAAIARKQQVGEERKPPGPPDPPGGRPPARRVG